MMDRDKKRQEEEMLVVHPARQAVADGGDENARGRAPGGPSRDEARRQLLAATDPAQRAAIVRSIQERFGNDVADALIDDIRNERMSQPDSTRIAEPPPEKKHGES